MKERRKNGWGKRGGREGEKPRKVSWTRVKRLQGGQGDKE